MIEYINYISLLIIPLFILFAILYGLAKRSGYMIPLSKAKEGPGYSQNISYLLTIL
jgi:spore maturation protein B